MSWHGIKRHIIEAENILKEYGLPFTFEDILEISPKPKDQYTAIAINMVVGYKYLQDEIKKNRIEQALNRLYSLCAMAEELWLYAAIPNKQRNKKGVKTRQTVLLNDDIEKILTAGFKAKYSKIYNGGHNKLPKELWQRHADNLFMPGELKIKLATRIHKKLYCDEKNITIEQIYRHITIPK